MRPQQNRRIRGRNNNNNNRRGPNPLSRNYESNGPDVKIRGNAQHIADKYTALARDAQAAGDRVMAENYLQHAEHYVRIILAAQAQMPQPIQREELIDDDEEDENTPVVSLELNEEHEAAGSGPQPEIQGVPAEVALAEDSDEVGKVVELKKPRRAPRRRSTPSSRSDGGENEAEEQVKEKAEASEETVEKPVAAEEVVEKKPRRRRTTKPKVEKAEEEA
ncbi:MULTISPECIES: DUF4167 domain-containing protein [Bartonella]|uniref:DUF4167 domain-containing protein n=1 Tax=Bartonella choladocola TaxID=2750995 RepID=A0A1U9MKX1_9HYPH|nr:MULTISPECIES: DUF4167 domain-containing protein [Bartonella]AQT48301.1 protein of unknown function (DUF4167) [Bartonella choladocola]MBH9975080.1 DUF4167 domain-containing protein [Bartonella choladocola]MBI0014686.1 DUF4167 domain-containing protein [Bartonella sp. B10834G3]